MSDPVIRGDTSVWRIPIVDPTTLEPHDLTGCTVWVTSKVGPDEDDMQAIYQHWITIDENGNVTGGVGLSLAEGGAAAGELIEELTPAESVLLIPGTYEVDVQVMTADGRITTPYRVEETVMDDITHAIERPE